MAGLVDDAHFVAGQRPAAADEAQCTGVVGGGRHGAAFAREGIALHGVDGRRRPSGGNSSPTDASARP